MSALLGVEVAIPKVRVGDYVRVGTLLEDTTTGIQWKVVRVDEGEVIVVEQKPGFRMSFARPAR